ncbi:serine hydrolase domain-containing protein [Brevibacterium litoralis]|uniref:serine hydrolase domain-containing protein n=1 Tax=Brevibacterium litoralis TaxID=3138935 RepID=UPI0032EED3B1
MRFVWRSVVGLVVVALVAGVGVYLWQRPMVLTGTGYAAHNACALAHVSGRDDVMSDLPDNPLVPVLRAEADLGAPDGESATSARDTEAPTPGASATVLGLLAEQQAWFTPGYGCTLSDMQPVFPDPTAVDGGVNPLQGASAAEETDAVDAALDAAFADVPGTRAVVALRDGQIVAERYADGFDAQTPQLGWSMSKSATNLVAGMLVAEGTVSLDDRDLVPEWTDERADITIEHLLRMTSGLEWDETYDLGSPITRMLYLEDDMGAFVAGQPAEHAPGTYQEYSSGSTNLLCDLLAERTGLGADLPRATLFTTLGLESAVMEPDAAGTPVCASYMWATPRDWATVGQFALQGGEWNGEQVLPAFWMDRTLTPPAPEVEETGDGGYGMGWRTNVLDEDGNLRWPELPEDAFSANGHDGQELIVIPSADMVLLRMGFTPDVDDLGTGPLGAALIAATE